MSIIFCLVPADSVGLPPRALDLLDSEFNFSNFSQSKFREHQEVRIFYI